MKSNALLFFVSLCMLDSVSFTPSNSEKSLFSKSELAQLLATGFHRSATLSEPLTMLFFFYIQK